VEIVSRRSTSTLAVLALLAACGGKVLGGGGSGGDQGGGAAGTGSGTFGSGTGSTGTGGTTTSTGTGTSTGSTGTGISTTGAGGGSVVCGGMVCPSGWACCNASCGGSCVPPGGACPGCGSAGAFGQGGGFVGAGGSNVMGCMTPPPARGLVASDMLSDLEAGTLITSITPGGGWFSFKDPEVATGFLPDPANFVAEAPGLHGTKMAVHVIGKGFMPPPSATNWGGGVGIALSLSGPTTPAPTDLSSYSGISFWAKSGSVVSDINVQIGTTDTDPNYCTCVSTNNCYVTHAFLLRAVPQAETKYTVRFAELKQPFYVTNPIPFDPTRVLTIIFASNGPVPYFDYWIDEVSLAK
jgi:hypothetical protein